MLPLVVLAALALMIAAWASPVAFMPPPRNNKARSPAATLATMAAAGGVLLPTAVQAQELPLEIPDTGSSITIASFQEQIMIGMVLGCVPTTILGLYVSAWLQFKKKPTLGL